MANANSAVVTQEPGSKVFAEDELSSLLLKSLGATNPAISQPLTDVAFAAPDLPTGATLDPAAQRALQQQQFQQFLRGEFAGAQREVRGVGEGPAAEQQSAVDALLNFFPRRELIQRGLRFATGGAGDRTPPLPPGPEAAPKPSLRGVVSRRTEAPKEPERRRTPPQISRLQKALGLAQDFERETGRRRATLQAAPPQLGESQDALERRLGGPLSSRFLGARTAEQAFFLSLGQEDPNSLGAKTTMDVARAALSAWHQGNEATVKEAFKLLGSRRSSTQQRRGRASTRAALAKQEDQLFDRLADRFDVSSLFGVDGGKFGMSGAEVFRAMMSPADARELMTEIQRGRDPQDIATEILARQQMEQFQAEAQQSENLQRRREEAQILSQDEQARRQQFQQQGQGQFEDVPTRGQVFTGGS